MFDSHHFAQDADDVLPYHFSDKKEAKVIKLTVLYIVIIALFMTGCSEVKSTREAQPAVQEYTSVEAFKADALALQEALAKGEEIDNRLNAYAPKIADTWLPAVAAPYTNGVTRIQVTGYSTVFLSAISDTSMDEDWSEPISVAWHREYTPNVMIAGWPVSGSLNSWKFDIDGVTFYVSELPLMFNKDKTSYAIFWGYNGRAFSANVPTWYTEKDIAELTKFQELKDYSSNSNEDAAD